MSELGCESLRKIVVETETVSYYSRATESTFADAVTVLYAKHRSATKDELSSAGASLKTVGMVWHLWDDELGGKVPKISDVVLDADSVRWVVLKVEKHAFGERWRLTCEKEL